MSERKLYISDLHFGHINVTKEGRDFDNRGFKNLYDMHEVITKKWNASVDNGDHVYILGDFCWKVNNGNIDYYKRLINNLNGCKHLILGNHDKFMNERYKKLFEEVVSYKEVTDTVNNANKKVILCHYYMPFYNHHYRNSIMLHGHSHVSAESEIERRITAMLNRQGYPCEIYNVGCMYPYIDYAPRTLQYIVDNYRKNVRYCKDGIIDEEDDYEKIIQALYDYHYQNPKETFCKTISCNIGNEFDSISDKEVLQKICFNIKNHNEVAI